MAERAFYFSRGLTYIPHLQNPALLLGFQRMLQKSPVFELELLSTVCRMGNSASFHKRNSSAQKAHASLVRGPSVLG